MLSSKEETYENGSFDANLSNEANWVYFKQSKIKNKRKSLHLRDFAHLWFRISYETLGLPFEFW